MVDELCFRHRCSEPVKLNSFDFELPERLIALRPQPRGSARLLHVTPGQNPVCADRAVKDIPGLLRPGDAFVVNTTRVIPAQLTGSRPARTPDGAPLSVGLTFHRRLSDGTWQAFAKPSRRLRAGDRLAIGGKPGVLVIREKMENGQVVVAAADGGANLDTVLENHGSMPLPPYIASRRNVDSRDLEDYQTVFAEHHGAVAAPTAGLHVSTEIIAALKHRGIEIIPVTLHVGAGTFLPVKHEDIRNHIMYSECGEITPASADRLNTIRQNGGRVISCGTTALRLLESATDPGGRVHAFCGETDIFITPGYTFRCVDALMTNFHLPKSTLFMLVAAFSGLDVMKAAYAHAISRNYRFYSYGDCSLLERPDARL